jgi:putative ABC transport system permease protein
MWTWTRLKRRLRALRAGQGLDGQLDRELQLHLELETDRYVRQGMSPAEARTLALRAFGGVERVREECRDARGVSWADAVMRNLRGATRMIRRQPGYAVAVIGTLGLGIGATTAMFSIVHGVLLKPLPYAEGDRLVLIRQSAPLAGQDEVGVSIRELYDYREQLADFSGLVEFHQMSFDLIERGDPDRVDTGVVSANFFDVLGIRPILGRSFVAADEGHGAEAVLILSHSYWQSRFGGDPHIVGRVFQMNDRPHTVIGVLPAVPQYPRECDVYMPTSACPFRARSEDRMGANRRAFGLLRVFGRLKAGVMHPHATAQVALVGERFRRDYPQVYPEGQGFQATTVGVLPELTRNARPMLLMLLGATVLVLLIACTNVVSLTVARTLNRNRELAMRTALGASRRHLVTQLLTESLLLAVLGGALGLAVAQLTLGALTTFIGRFTARTGEVTIDGPVLLFTMLVSVASGVIVGVLPALLTGNAPAAALKQAGASAGPAPSRRRVQHALVVAQVAVSVVLVASAGLLLTSLHRLQQVNPGYRDDKILSAEVFGNFTRYPTAEACLALYEPLIERLTAQPGVVSAAVSSAVPLASVEPFLNGFEIEGEAPAPAGSRPNTDVTIVSPGYFDTLGIPLVSGRTFAQTDTRDAAPVALVSRTMARHWGRRSPVGSRVSVDGRETWATVVGVVGDVRQYGLEREALAQVYLPLSQTPAGLAGRLLVRTTGDPGAMANVMRNAVRSLDPNIPVENVRTLEELRSRYLATPRLTALLLGLFAAVALIVCLAGLTGVIATSVSQRTREFGLRMALGAQPARLLGDILRQGTMLVILGLAMGLAGAAVSGRVLTNYLFDTQPTDPLTLAGVAGAMLIAGVVACLGPARRATRVDPILALRAD